MSNYHGRKSLDLGLLEIETKTNALNLKVLEAFKETFDSFYEKDLEQEFLSYRWTKIWKNIKVLLYFDILIGMVVRFDDIFIQQMIRYINRLIKS